MLTLYQAEWCPFSHRVRQRLTELGVDYVAKQVAAEPEEREEMRTAVGGDGIPTLVTDDGDTIDDWKRILAWLDERFQERDDAGLHRAKLRAEAEARDPRSDEYPR